MQRTLFVGDVHGCREELELLLEKAGFSSGDRLVFVGDLVNKGPDPKGVVQLARKLGALSVLGNHDALFLECADTPPNERVPLFGAELAEQVASFSDEELNWLRGLPLFLKFDELNVIVVHAGLVPGLPLEKQSREHLLNMRTIRNGVPSSKFQEGSVPWASLWRGPERVIFGHDVARGLQRWPHAIGLDTGCVYGGRLTGLWLPEERFVSVPARRAWKPVEMNA
ncbi:MAG: metallophosphoesterase [Sandaracinaceae bacterium]|nr:metallophosphoesterase [Sandaracinaceae bacterium]